MFGFFREKIVPLQKMQALMEHIEPILSKLKPFFVRISERLDNWYSIVSNKLTIKTKMILWEIFLVLLLVCVVIVANKIASLSAQSAANEAVVGGDVVTEVLNDTILGKSYSVKVHKTEVQEYDYWLHTDSVYNVGDSIKE